VVSINICIDIGTHILSLNKIGKPETYSEIFENLSNLGLINKKKNVRKHSEGEIWFKLVKHLEFLYPLPLMI